MHVLAATNNLYPDPSATGSGRYNYEVGRRLVERGHRVSVITRQRGDAPARETVAGMDVYRYGASVPRLPATMRTIEGLVESVRAREPVDLVSFHGALSSFGVDRATPDAVPRTYTIHGLWGVEYRDRLVDPSPWAAPYHWLNRTLRHRVEGRVLGHSDAAVVLSEFQRGRVRDHHPDAPPVRVVPGGVDVERFAPLDGPAPEAFGGEDISLLTVRRLTPRMGLETLLDAFARVVDDGLDAHLYVGGDGPLRGDLAARAERLGVASDVTFLGYVPEDDLPGLYAGADAFVLPTLELEGFGLATLEALASGTPVVGTTAGATPEILGPLESRPEVPEPLLVPPGERDALADRLAAWARLSASERAAAGEACRAYVLDAGYTWAAVTDRLEALFGDVRAGSASGGTDSQ
ncbi:glycosyltransferase family 4 protein [Halosimplex pelagicum]|uniref:Glycosyltransferase family 4 protein n=1 Tax=Halosimplex pelagicum TaxID=869886 RepID=A0A7D5SUK5_9EURY|nr:glycosyltransferase family 4 protein [Halosimplex pelagicum]QLH81407.1 glycosyltransferase family 4 protein [Halosimplex pelagicum]